MKFLSFNCLEENRKKVGVVRDMYVGISCENTGAVRFITVIVKLIGVNLNRYLFESQK